MVEAFRDLMIVINAKSDFHIDPDNIVQPRGTSTPALMVPTSYNHILNRTPPSNARFQTHFITASKTHARNHISSLSIPTNLSTSRRFIHPHPTTYRSPHERKFGLPLLILPIPTIHILILHISLVCTLQLASRRARTYVAIIQLLQLRVWVWVWVLGALYLLRHSFTCTSTPIGRVSNVHLLRTLYMYTYLRRTSACTPTSTYTTIQISQLS